MVRHFTVCLLVSIISVALHSSSPTISAYLNTGVQAIGENFEEQPTTKKLLTTSEMSLIDVGLSEYSEGEDNHKVKEIIDGAVRTGPVNKLQGIRSVQTEKEEAILTTRMNFSVPYPAIRQMYNEIMQLNKSLLENGELFINRMSSMIRDSKLHMNGIYQEGSRKVRSAQQLHATTQALIQEMTHQVKVMRSEMTNLANRVSLCDTRLNNVDLQKELFECRKYALTKSMILKSKFSGSKGRVETMKHQKRELAQRSPKKNSRYESTFRKKSTKSDSLIKNSNETAKARPFPRECSEISLSTENKTKVQLIQPDPSKSPIEVLCHFDEGSELLQNNPVNSQTNRSGTIWTVIQRRINGSLDFSRKWADYAAGFNGFSNEPAEFWMGNEHLYQLTYKNDSQMKLKIEMWTEDNYYWAQYDHFRVGPANDNYRLQISGYQGNASDAFSSANDHLFATIDHIVEFAFESCPVKTKSGWWNPCHYVSLNGPLGESVWWFNFAEGKFIRPVKTRMMVAPATHGNIDGHNVQKRYVPLKSSNLVTSENVSDDISNGSLNRQEDTDNETNYNTMDDDNLFNDTMLLLKNIEREDLNWKNILEFENNSTNESFSESLFNKGEDNVRKSSSPAEINSGSTSIKMTKLLPINSTNKPTLNPTLQE